MSEMSDPVPLPPGWDCKYDAKTGRYYFINYYTKSTTWEDPRFRYRLPSHGTPIHFGGGISECIPLQELSNNSARMSPVSARGITQITSKFQDASVASTDTEQLVTKIGAMFPTVTETHIRLLLKKYMKSIFPAVDETILLDVLSNNDNNVQKASEALVSMGFQRKEMKPLISSTPRKSDAQKSLEESKKSVTPPPVKLKTLDEKKKIKAKLQSDYNNVPEQIINIALESVHYDSDRANQILQIMVQEDNKPKETVEVKSVHSEEKADVQEIKNEIVVEREVKQSTSIPKIVDLLPEQKDDVEVEKENGKTWMTKNKKQIELINDENVESNEKGYRSVYSTKPVGPNKSLQKGANVDILLPDYVTWNGANPSIINGKTGLAKGNNKNLLQNKTYQAKGSDTTKRKGPLFGLAKGSIYSQLKAVLCESRSK